MGNTQQIISPGRWSNTWETSISGYWGNGSFLSGCEYNNPIYTATDIFKLVPDETNAWMCLGIMLKNNGIQSNKSATFTTVVTSNLISMKFYFYYPTNKIT